MTTAIVTTPAKLSVAIGELREALKETGWLRVTWRHDKDRTARQNALAHAWYEQIAQELHEGTQRTVRGECKLLYGVPILRSECPEYREQYDRLIKRRFTHEEKIDLMAGSGGDDDGYPVTRLMTTGQLSQYLEAIRDAYANRVALEFPDEARWAA